MKEILNPGLLEKLLTSNELHAVFDDSIMPFMSLYSLERGELLCRQGEALTHLYVLVEGKLKVYTTSFEGKTLILSFQTPLDIIGDIEYVQNTDIINTVEAVTPVYLIAIQVSHLRRYAGDHAPFLKFLLKVITDKFYIKSNYSSLNLMYPVEVRLASYLLSVSNPDGTGKNQAVSISDAANLIGTSYRHMNRVVLKFAEEGLLERKRGLIQVKDRSGLQAYANRSIYESAGLTGKNI